MFSISINLERNFTHWLFVFVRGLLSENPYKKIKLVSKEKFEYDKFFSRGFSFASQSIASRVLLGARR